MATVVPTIRLTTRSRKITFVAKDLSSANTNMRNLELDDIHLYHQRHVPQIYGECFLQNLIIILPFLRVWEVTCTFCLSNLFDLWVTWNTTIISPVILLFNFEYGKWDQHIFLHLTNNNKKQRKFIICLTNGIAMFVQWKLSYLGFITQWIFAWIFEWRPVNNRSAGRVRWWIIGTCRSLTWECIQEWNGFKKVVLHGLLL